MKSPLIYKKTKIGIRTWQIWTEPSKEGQIAIAIEHGLKDGKKVKASRLIKAGKSLGSIAETSIIEQAEKEALSEYKHQMDKGYKENIEDCEELFLLPMLANDFRKRGRSIQFPCLAQRKFDGARCLAYLEE